MRILLSVILVAITARAAWVERYHRGEDLLNQGRHNEAVREFRSALAEHPDHAPTLDALGRAEMSAGRYRSAKNHFERAIQHTEDKAPSQTNLAIAFIALGEHRRAEQLLGQLLIADPRNHIARRALAQALHQQGRDAEAAPILEALLLEYRDQTARADLSVIYEALNKPAKALELLLQTIPDLQPGQARARLLTNLGVLQWKTGAGKESEVTLQKALVEMEAAIGKHHPDTAWILEQYSHVLRAHGRKTDARHLSERAASIRSSFAVEANTSGLTVDWRDTSRR